MSCVTWGKSINLPEPYLSLVGNVKHRAWYIVVGVQELTGTDPGGSDIVRVVSKKASEPELADGITFISRLYPNPLLTASPPTPSPLSSSL